MNVFHFFNNRQYGAFSREKSSNPHPKLNFDNVISRLTCQKNDVFTVRGEESDVPPFSCRFRKDAQSDLLAVATEDGDIALYDTSEISPETLLKSFAAHHNAIFDICWLSDKCQLISGSGDHNATLWDISACKPISVFKKHSASVKTVDVCHEQSAIFASGSRDGSINIWDTRVTSSNNQTKPVISISQAHYRKNVAPNGKKSLKDPVCSVSSVVFQDSHNLASAGAADGVVKIWDLRKTYVQNSKYLPSPRFSMNYSDSKNTGRGCTSLVFDSHYRNLYGCSTNNKIFKFNCHSYSKEVVSWYEGFRCATYFVKLAVSYDNQYLLCGSSDDKAYIWKASDPGLPIFQLPGHTAEVTSVCWSPHDVTKLATCGDDNKVAIWRISKTEKAEINDDIHAIIEPFSESPKNSSLSSPGSDQSSTIASNTPARTTTKRSPVESLQTPNKPASRVITNFFSPVTSVAPTPVKDSPSPLSENSKSPVKKSPSLKSPAGEVSSHILTPSNLINRENIMNPSTSGCSENKSSPSERTISPDHKMSGTSTSTPSSVCDKENANSELSPETVIKTNSSGQTKRKSSPNNCTPNVKRKFSDSASKSRRPGKNVKKTVTAGRTIKNYFSVVLSPDS